MDSSCDSGPKRRRIARRNIGASTTVAVGAPNDNAESEALVSYVIAIRSYRRADGIQKKTLRFLDENNVPRDRIYIFAGSDELDVYREALDDDRITVADGGSRGVSFCNKCIKSFFPPGQHVVQMDDDVHYVIDRNRERVPLLRIIAEGSEQMKRTGYRIWGLYPVANPYFMRHDVVYGLKFLIGCLFGFINDRALNTKDDCREDYERTIQHFDADGGVVRLDKYATVADLYVGNGGWASVRTTQMMEASCQYMLKTYPQ